MLLSGCKCSLSEEFLVERRRQMISQNVTQASMYWLAGDHSIKMLLPKNNPVVNPTQQQAMQQESPLPQKVFDRSCAMRLFPASLWFRNWLADFSHWNNWQQYAISCSNFKCGQKVAYPNVRVQIDSYKIIVAAKILMNVGQCHYDAITYCHSGHYFWQYLQHCQWICQRVKIHIEPKCLLLNILIFCWIT